MAIWWRIILFGLVAAIWAAFAELRLSVAGDFICVVGLPLAVYPLVWRARRLLDREPTPANARALTPAVHACILALYGPAVIKAFGLFGKWHGWTITLPQSATNALFVATGIVMTLTVINLALRSYGAPFAIALSRRLATDRLYRRTRNPMVLATIFWFVSIGFAMQSASFVFWVLFVFVPVELEYLLVYEERELEIRFGKDYLAYKARTPFLWPRLFPAKAAAIERMKENA